MHIGVPKLQQCLPLEPFLHYQKTVDHARLVLLASSRLCGLDDSRSDDRAVSDRDPVLRQLAWYDLFDLMPQT
jgi:hypothetical protein